MPENEIHVGDVGTVFEITLMDGDVVVPLGDATVLQIVFTKARRQGTVTMVAVLTSNGDDGKLQYVTVAGDLSAAGKWKVQAIVTLPSGVWHSDIGYFTVHKNLA